MSHLRNHLSPSHIVPPQPVTAAFPPKSPISEIENVSRLMPGEIPVLQSGPTVPGGFFLAWAIHTNLPGCLAVPRMMDCRGGPRQYVILPAFHSRAEENAVTALGVRGVSSSRRPGESRGRKRVSSPSACVSCQVTSPRQRAGDRDVRGAGPDKTCGIHLGRERENCLARLVSLLQESCWGRGSALIRDHAVVPVHFELELELDCSTFSLLKNENNSSSTPHPSLQPSVEKKKKGYLFGRPGLSCDTWNLLSSLQHAACMIFSCGM